MNKKLTILAVVVLVFATIPKVAQAGHLMCGDTIVADTVLDGNLSCTTTSGLIIGADGVTLNLNGFTLSGATCSACHGVRVFGFDNVTIENGVIEGFEQGVRATSVKGLTLKHLTFSGQTSSHAVDVLDSNDVQIRESSFTMPVTEAVGPEAIRLASVNDAKVEYVDIQGGFIGVNFACGTCDGSEAATIGIVKSNVIHGANIGILIANSTKAEVIENHVSGGVTVTVPFTIGGKGISAGFAAAVTVSGLKIAKNHVHDIDGFGIRFLGVTGSEVSDNELHVNTGDGIALLVIDSTGSTGNTITNNTSTGNGAEDMRHDGTSSPNTWTGNKCVNSDGADIDCGT